MSSTPSRLSRFSVRTPHVICGLEHFLNRIDAIHRITANGDTTQRTEFDVATPRSEPQTTTAAMRPPVSGPATTPMQCRTADHMSIASRSNPMLSRSPKFDKPKEPECRQELVTRSLTVGPDSTTCSGSAVGGRPHRRRRLRTPRPATLEFDLEAEAENGPDGNNDRQHADTFQGWRDGNRSNDVRRNQQLEPEQNRPAHALTKDPIAACRVHLVTKRQHRRREHADHDGGNTSDIHTLADRFD